MILMPEYKMLYMDCPKTGTQTLTDVFLGYYGGTRHGGMHENQLPPGKTHKWDDWQIIISIRHPYRRALSLWWSMTQRNKEHNKYRGQLLALSANDGYDVDDPVSFMRWLIHTPADHPLKRTMAEQYGAVIALKGSDLKGVVCIDTEHMERCLYAINGELWTKYMHELPRRNHADSWSKAGDKATPEFREAVQAWCSDDFKVFGYDPTRND